MNRAFRFAACAGMIGLVALTGGCAADVSASQFLAKYTNNIEVPNPDRPELPCRVFLGLNQDGQYYLKDVIPYGQGGGFLGKTAYWRCPASELPKGFLYTYRPGDVVLDGRPGSKHTYMIQWFRAMGERRQRPPAK
jgi:hypothetical protein